MMHTRRVMLVALALMTVGGCVKTHSNMPDKPPSPNPPPRVAADPAVRVQTLSQLSDAYARLSNQLPGPNERDHRRLMSQAFAQLEQILSILEGPNPGAEFRQQLQIISDAQTELSSGPEDLSSEPMINTGLRAALDALTRIRQTSYYDTAELTPLFDRLAEKINELDTVRGPLHQVVAAEAISLTSQIVGKMADVMGQRLAQQSASGASQPTSEPASQPTSEPAAR
jgi:hypothetical protein